MQLPSASKAFTLIELLIVVAIIAILAAIAVPNFLEAQTRSKVSRVKSDLRTYATGLESYYVDSNTYPPCNTFGIAVNNTSVGGTQDWDVLERLSTPIAYLTSGLLPDAFETKYTTRSVYTGNDPQIGFDGIGAGYGQENPSNPIYASYGYQSGGDVERFLPGFNTEKGKTWVMHSPGPDLIRFNMGGILANNSETQDGRTVEQKKAYCANLIYDPTNGTISFGEVFRAGGATNTDYARYFYQTVAGSQ